MSPGSCKMRENDEHAGRMQTHCRRRFWGRGDFFSQLSLRYWVNVIDDSPTVESFYRGADWSEKLKYKISEREVRSIDFDGCDSRWTWSCEQIRISEKCRKVLWSLPFEVSLAKDNSHISLGWNRPERGEGKKLCEKENSNNFPHSEGKTEKKAARGERNKVFHLCCCVLTEGDENWQMCVYLFSPSFFLACRTCFASSLLAHDSDLERARRRCLQLHFSLSLSARFFSKAN